MKTFDVSVMVCVRIRAKDGTRAENIVLDLFHTHTGQMLDCPAVVETSIALTPTNPTSVEVEEQEEA